MIHGLQTIKGAITPRDIKMQDDDTSNKIVIALGVADKEGNVTEATGTDLETLESYCC